MTCLTRDSGRADMTDRKCAVSGSVDTPIVSVVDNDATMRQSLESLIRGAGWRARSFTSGLDFLACPRELIPGCLVVDAMLADLSALDLQQRIADRPETPIIFITRGIDVRTTVQAMKAGAFEFMLKPFRPDAMLSAITSAIAHSRTALNREADLQVLRHCHASLSQREQQVMNLVVQGRLNKVIGAELGISEITVKAHRGSVMRKMRARSLPELVAIAAGLQLPTPADRWLGRASAIHASRMPPDRGYQSLYASSPVPTVALEI